ncbi:MAG: hypothetical protein ACK52V_04765 [Betaproteobacteria bacterium]
MSAIFEAGAASQLIQATTGGAAVEVTAAQLGSYVGCKQLYVYNSGTVAIAVGVGTTSAEAITNAAFPTAGTPAGGLPMPGGVVQVITEGRFPQWVAARTLTGTADVYIAPGIGA